MNCMLFTTLLIIIVGYSRVSNETGQYNFSGQWDRSFFIVPTQRDNGTSSKSCQGTGRDNQNSGRAGIAKTGTGHGTKRDRAEKDVLKQENDVLKQKMMF